LLALLLLRKLLLLRLLLLVWVSPPASALRHDPTQRAARTTSCNLLAWVGAHLHHSRFLSEAVLVLAPLNIFVIDFVALWEERVEPQNEAPISDRHTTTKGRKEGRMEGRKKVGLVVMFEKE
jgi:hypothetical protein